jgi:hypothetical protein
VDVATQAGPTVPAERFVPPMGALTAVGAVAGALVVLLGAMAWATTLPQRGWKAFSTWLLRRPSEAELAQVHAGDVSEHRYDPEPLTQVAGRWIAKLRKRG